MVGRNVIEGTFIRREGKGWLDQWQGHVDACNKSTTINQTIRTPSFHI